MEQKKLYDTLDGLQAYDIGATDSGISDESLRQEVCDYLNNLKEDERNKVLTGYIMEYYLSEFALGQGYGIAEVKSFLSWLEGEMDIYI